MKDKMENDILKKARKFASKDNKLTSERYNEIKKEWNRTIEKRDKGEITAEATSIICQRLLQEREEAEIKFDNEKDFRDFSNFLSSFAKIPISFVLEQVEHEIEHSKIYKDAGIKSYFGWHNFSIPTGNKLIKGKMFKPFHHPFGENYDSLSPFEKDRLSYKSLNNVSEQSDSDKEAIKELKRRRGENIEQ